MTLRFDPADIVSFKKDIQQIPGYPAGEELPIKAMVFEAGALVRLRELLLLAGANPTNPLWVVMDRIPMRRGADELKPLILSLLQNAGWQAQPLWLEADASGQVHTDFGQINAVKAQLNRRSAVLSVGSGVVTDVAKHACFLFEQETGVHIPFVVYQTANSVSAYTSNMAPVFVEGVKRTLPSRYPDVLICDLETLRDAPQAMTAAGVGDLLAAFGSFADWYLAYHLGIDPTYNEFAQTLMGPLDTIFLEEAPAIRQASLPAMATLAKLIALGGLAMSLSHATAPLSGYEHVTSHVLDLIAEQAQQPLAMHGSQVALATVLTTGAYQHFISELEPAEVNPDHCYPSATQMEARVRAAFDTLDSTGKVANECWADYKIKLDLWHQHRAEFEAFLKDWPRHRQALLDLTRPPELALQILRETESPLTFADLQPPVTTAQAKFAFLSAPLIRRRLTLGDLFIFLNWDRDQLWNEVNQMLSGLSVSQA